jgi:hypothetical protein
LILGAQPDAKSETRQVLHPNDKTSVNCCRADNKVNWS